MLRINTLLLCILILVSGSVTALRAQNGVSNPNLQELPIVLSWDDDGPRITVKTSDEQAGNLLEMTPFRYLDQIGNDLIRVANNTGNTPVVIDLSTYYQPEASPNISDLTEPKIQVFMPKLTFASYSEQNSFTIDLRNYSSEVKNSRQLFIFKGLDVFYVGADNDAVIASNQNRVIVDVEKCNTKYLMLKGGILDLADVEDKIPSLCRKYNDRYYIANQADAFVCLADCTADNSNSIQNIKHSRSLVTKYNITDYEDAPISFLNNMLITKKGVGLNLKTQEGSEQKAGRKAGKKAAFNTYDEYRFFPWYEFINLSFTKYIDESQLLIQDPYNNSYVYTSKIHFSNVELIQFFNELKALISDRVNQ